MSVANSVFPSERIREQILAAADRPLDQGTTFPPQAYTDPDHYQFEVANILRREWLSHPRSCRH